MWILIFLFGIVTFILGWTCFGYYMFLWFIGLFKKGDREFTDDAEMPFLTVIVPCFDEAENILDKINNLKQQNYPSKRLEILFVDGGSDDGTVDIIKENIKQISYIRLLECPQKGKINQLNHALSESRGNIIINTDVDGRMEKDCLNKLAEEFRRDTNVAVVSAFSSPKNVKDVEGYYWQGQNKGRLLETRAYTSSIAIAVCYAFKKDLLKSFPEDVVADDIYTAYLANTLGYKTLYSTKVRVFEIRGAKNTEEFVTHKFRKSNAFLKETLRFIYRLPEMHGFWRMIFLTKLSQLLFLPWCCLLWVVLSVCLISIKRFDVVFLGTLFLLGLLVITSRILSRVKVPEIHKKYTFTVSIKTYILSNLILFATGLSYPFYKQDSSYQKLKQI